MIIIQWKSPWTQPHDQPLQTCQAGVPFDLALFGSAFRTTDRIRDWAGMTWGEDVPFIIGYPKHPETKIEIMEI